MTDFETSTKMNRKSDRIQKSGESIENSDNCNLPPKCPENIHEIFQREKIIQEFLELFIYIVDYQLD